MLRKITIAGFVLIISEAHEHARVLVGICVSATFLMLQLLIRPYAMEAECGGRDPNSLD